MSNRPENLIVLREDGTLTDVHGCEERYGCCVRRARGLGSGTLFLSARKQLGDRVPVPSHQRADASEMSAERERTLLAGSAAGRAILRSRGESDDSEASLSREREAELLSHSPAGRQVLAERQQRGR